MGDVMKYLITCAIIALLLLLVGEGRAENKAPTKYLNAKGMTIEATEALKAAIGGETVFKCQQVEAKQNKKGTSWTLRLKK